MARLARADLVDPAEVATYHCVNRCVRRSFLCGDDPYSGQNYDHRKAWLEMRLRFLAGQFGIDVIGFAIMSNHFHLVIRSRPDVVAEWDDTEVARRWLLLCPVRKDDEGRSEEPNEAELDMIRRCPERFTEIRSRLSDISWLMRMMAEQTARRANREDNVTGRFWEGRYKCAKICDERAMLASLAYVDLNPIRAGIAKTPEASDYTSVQRRIESQTSGKQRDAWLAPLEIDESQTGPVVSRSVSRASDKGCLPISLADYLQLLDWTGRQFVQGKRGTIPSHSEPILTRIGIAPTGWLQVVGQFGRYFHRVAGAWRSVAGEHPHSNPAATFHPGRCDLLEAA